MKQTSSIFLCTLNHVSICRLPEAKCEDRPAQNTGSKTKEEELIIKKSDTFLGLSFGRGIILPLVT